jgi:sulfopyruvate decarboxylase TPP-binding subunit
MDMFDGGEAVKLFERLGVTHVVWLPDSELGTWHESLSQSSRLKLIRVCREGEAFGIAAGLHLGGARPIVVIQCTGFYEAGDAMRNVVHDLGLPIFMIVGYRGFYGGIAGRKDTAATFLEPIVRAWNLPHKLFTKESSIDELGEFYAATQREQQAAAALIAETRT